MEMSVGERIERALLAAFPGATRQAVERLATHAGLNVSQLPLDGSTADMVYTVVKSARSERERLDLVRAALRDLPVEEAASQLEMIREALEAPTRAAVQIEDARRDLAAHRVALRQPAHLSKSGLQELGENLQTLFDLMEFQGGSAAAGLDAEDAGDSGESSEGLEALADCVDALQVYKALLERVPRTKRRVPGAEIAIRPLADVASDEVTLVDAKRQLATALTNMLRATRRPPWGQEFSNQG